MNSQFVDRQPQRAPKSVLRQASGDMNKSSTSIKKAPPPLTVFDGASQDLDRFNAIKMQYKALFQKGKPQKLSSAYKEPTDECLTPPIRQPNIEPPKVSPISSAKLVQKGNSIMDQAQTDIATKSTNNDLRTHIQTIHSQILSEKNGGWADERTKLMGKVDELEKKLARYHEQSQNIEQKDVNSDEKQEEMEFNELLTERATLQEQLISVEAENQTLQADIEVVNEKLGLLQDEFAQKEADKEKEIHDLKVKLERSVDRQIDNLKQQVTQLKAENLKLNNENMAVKEQWKGRHDDIQPIWTQSEDATTAVERELQEIKTTMQKLTKEREAFEKEKKDFAQEKKEFYNEIQGLEQKDQRVKIYDSESPVGLKIEQIINQNSRKLMDLWHGDVSQVPYASKAFDRRIREESKQPAVSAEINPQLQSLRNTLKVMKAKHDQSMSVQDSDAMSVASKASYSSQRPIHSPAMSPIERSRSVSPMASSQLGNNRSRLQNLGQKVNTPRFEGSKAGSISQVSIDRIRRDDASNRSFTSDKQKDADEIEKLIKQRKAEFDLFKTKNTI